MWPTWEQLTPLLIALGGAFGWWTKRRDRASTLDRENATLKTDIAQLREDLATAMAEAEKTNRSHQDAIAALQAEIAEWRRQVERRDDRITALEDRLYTGGGPT